MNIKYGLGFLSITLIIISGSIMTLLAEQKVVLISGATTGIGLATAKAFHDKGWKVWAGFRQDVPDELKKISAIKCCHLEVTDSESVQSAIATILKEDKKIDALINNAGYGLIGAEECVTIQEAQQLFDVNFFGVLRLIQAVLPIMRQQRSGHIINISSGVGIHSFPGLGIYSASKFALEGMSESLAAICSQFGIKVSIVEPGFVKTNWGNNCIVGSRACNEELYSKLTHKICTMLSTPQGQPAEEIAALLVAIAQNPQPDLRYQTSDDMKEYIGEKLVDPTGNVTNQQNIQFLNRRLK